MTTKKIPFNYDINRMLAVDLIAVIHIDDYDTRLLELTLFDSGTPFSVDGCTVTARFVTISGNYLLSDNVPCEAAENTITIPIDAAAVQEMACDIKIEVNIVDGGKILTLPFPLWVRVRGSILEDAHITPESQGTIPELLEEVKEELARVEGYVDEEQVKQIIDGVLSGVTTNVPTLLIDSAVDQQYNPDGHLIWYYIDSGGTRHNLFDFTPYIGGTDDYNDLENKPQINGYTLSGNKTSDDLELQKKLTAGQNITIENDGTISASGGVTSYDDLTDKPAIKTPFSPEYPLAGLLQFDNVFLIRDDTLEGRNFYSLTLNGIYDIMLDKWQNYLIGAYLDDDSKYDFNSAIRGGYAYTEKSGHFCCLGKNLVNVPQEFSTSISDNSKVMIIHYYTIQPSTNNYTYFLRTIYFQDIANSKIRFFAQWAYVVQEEDDYVIYPITAWQEIGGSQIVSGVVNQNGTITFTDSDGNTFTTSGESVIGADGFSPTAAVTQTASGATVTITDKNGTTTANISNGADGQDYVLTNQDKTDIANIVLSELPTTQGVLYGNTNN